MKKADVMIRRPVKEDIHQIEKFFRIVLEDTFRKEGIEENIYDMLEELASKKRYLASDFHSGVEERYFLIAVSGREILGTMESGKQSKLLLNLTKGKLSHLPEVGTAFVHPDHQGQGIASLLLEEMEKELERKGFAEYCLDSGYQRAQKIWFSKFGTPCYIFENYWAQGVSHMIWKVKISCNLTDPPSYETEER